MGLLAALVDAISQPLVGSPGRVLLNLISRRDAHSTSAIEVNSVLWIHEFLRQCSLNRYRKFSMLKFPDRAVARFAKSLTDHARWPRFAGPGAAPLLVAMEQG